VEGILHELLRQRDSYTAFLGEPGGVGGKWAEHGKTPEAAVKATRKVARKEVKHLADLLDAAVNG
jgi:hypothetical protein